MGLGNGCCGSSRGRSYFTKTEKIAKLNDYKGWLDSEAQGVQEAISELKKAS